MLKAAFFLLLLQQIDPAYNLSVVRDPKGLPVRVLLVDRANRNRFWELVTFTEPAAYKITRANRSSAVVARVGDDYGYPQGFTKLFFDVDAKRLIKRIDYGPETSLSDISTEEAQRSLNVDLGTVL